LGITRIDARGRELDDNFDRWVIVAGERRWRAAQLAGLTHLHALVHHDLADADVLPRAVAENLGRADMTPMEEAEAFSRLAAAGYDRAEIAAMCGKTVEYVGYRIDLLALTDACAEALNVGHLPVGTAWYVAKLTPAGQQRFLRKWVRGEFATARDAEAFVQACRSAEEHTQGGFFQIEEMSPERREQVETQRRRVTSRIDRLAGAGQILQDLATTDPNELALVLAGLPGGVGGYRMRVDHLRDMASKAAATLRRAGAIAAAAGPDHNHTDTIF
jgi:ParB/RepB/Spo0J family partition protein